MNRLEILYQRYCLWCEGLDIFPADFETWKKTTASLSDT